MNTNIVLRAKNIKKTYGVGSAHMASEHVLQQVMFSIMADNMELFKQFQDNTSFKKWLYDMIFNITYNTDNKSYQNLMVKHDNYLSAAYETAQQELSMVAEPKEKYNVKDK